MDCMDQASETFMRCVCERECQLLLTWTFLLRVHHGGGTLRVESIKANVPQPSWMACELVA